MNRTLLETFTILILASLMLYSLALNSWSETVNAGENAKGFLPVILGDDPLLPPATMIPLTQTPTPTQTATSTPTLTATATPTSTPTETPVPEPLIENFKASPYLITSEQSSELSWVVSGDYDSLNIQPNVGDVTHLTKVMVSPEKNTQYTLTVEYTRGQEKKKQTAKLTVKVGEPGEELVVFNLNRPVTTADNGFPRIEGSEEIPAEVNGDWTLPPNFAEGSFYLRWEIRSQPVPQDMQLQFCLWQSDPVMGGYYREHCTNGQVISGDTGSVQTKWQLLRTLWVKDVDHPIDWTQPRKRIAMAIKNENGCPVTNFSVPEEIVLGRCPIGDNGFMLTWAGEDPGDWYPLDLCFSVIAVGQNLPFSGWENYSYLCETVPPENLQTTTIP